MRAWQKLCRTNARISPQMRRKLLQGILQPKAAKNYSEATAMEETWERHMARYHETARDRLPEDALVVS